MKALSVLTLISVLFFGFSALASSSKLSADQMTFTDATQRAIHCEKCVCNLQTGICDCTNCTIEMGDQDGGN